MRRSLWITQRQMTDGEVELAITRYNPIQRRSYTPKFKLEVVNYALQQGNRAAQRKFHVNEKSVRYWRKQQKKLENCKADKRKLTPCRSKWPDLEALLKSWILEQKEWGTVLSIKVMCQKAVEFAEMLKIEGFRGSNNWVGKFLFRNKISLKHVKMLRRSKNSRVDWENE